MDTLPANQTALAATLKAVSGKPLRSFVDRAELLMDDLRKRGFRVVSFPSKDKGKKARKSKK